MPRIQKVLAGAGVASRRNVEQMIRDGRIALNGRIVTDLPILVDPDRDAIQVDGEPVNLGRDNGGPRLYMLLNKPKNVYTTNVAQGEQTRAVDLLPQNLPGRVYPVGRLEADGYVTPQSMQALSRGVWLSDGGAAAVGSRTGRSFVKVVKRSRDLTILEITIREGRNGHIRRLLARVGHKVRDLTRIKMGPLTLEGLAPGKSRNLTSREIMQLRKITTS